MKKNSQYIKLTHSTRSRLGAFLLTCLAAGTATANTSVLCQDDMPMRVADDKPSAPAAYALFDAKGKKIGFKEMVAQLAEADVVFVGEVHNCCITHWMEMQITQALHQIHGNRLMMGAEMFEADNQLLMDEYMKRVISYDSFEDEARLWPNYQTDYSALVYYAKEHAIPFVATNVPRRYASVVKNKGLEYLDSLSDEAKRYLPPLPIKFSKDEEQEEMFSMMRMMGKGHGEKSFLSEAQAIKDATMGWFIAQRMKDKFLHFNGNYHSDFKKGIVPYLLEYRPGTKVKTVCSVRQETVDALDEVNQGRADFYICVPEDMTTSY